LKAFAGAGPAPPRGIVCVDMANLSILVGSL
jgi:hypothetical protein